MSWVHLLLIKVSTHLGVMVSHWMVLTSSFLDDDYFKVLSLLFHYQAHNKCCMLNVSDVKAKYVTGNTVPGCEISLNVIVDV